MATEYKSADKRFREDEESPIAERDYHLLMVDPLRVEFDEGHTTVKAALKEAGDDRDKLHQVALRTQIIREPGRALNAGGQLLQFFAENPNDEELRNGKGAILFETDGDKETPLLYLSKADVFAVAHGEGVAVALRDVALSA